MSDDAMFPGFEWECEARDEALAFRKMSGEDVRRRKLQSH